MDIFTPQRGYDFRPFGVSYYGSFGKSAIVIVEMLSTRLCRALDLDYQLLASQMISQRLSLTLQQYLARCVLMRKKFPELRYINRIGERNSVSFRRR